MITFILLVGGTVGLAFLLSNVHNIIHGKLTPIQTGIAATSGSLGTMALFGTGYHGAEFYELLKELIKNEDLTPGNALEAALIKKLEIFFQKDQR